MHEPMNDEDSELRDLLRILSPQARGYFHEALMRGQAAPDRVAARLLRYRDVNGPAWADLVDRLALDPALRRRCVRLLGELEGEG
jgi:hypothetical protein